MTFLRATGSLRGHGLLLGLVLAVVGMADGNASALPEPVARALASQRIESGSVSVLVQRLDDQEPLLAYLSDQPRNPASVMKLFTTFAALDFLGPAYRWETSVHAESVSEDGVVDQLWIKGSGDPYLLDEDIWRLAGSLRRAGVRHIAGGLVLDTSAFALRREDPAAFDGEPWRAYNQPPHALLVNFNAVRFHVRGDRRRDRVDVRPEPALPGIRVDNRLRLADRDCGGYQRGVAFHVGSDSRIQLEGTYPAGCDDAFRLVRRVVEPEDYLTGLFRIVWEQWGGRLDGNWVHGHWQRADREPLAVHESRPLGEIIRLANKYSSNVMTRHLKLTMGAERHGFPATDDKGEAAMLEVLTDLGLDVESMVLDNAAGLSRANRVTARQVADLLIAAHRHPFAAEFRSSLAIAGMDGTVRRRLADAPEAGRMHLKTGRLDNVSTIAGYVRAADETDYVVVVMVNAPGAHRGAGEAIQDAVLRWVYAR